jgi:BlaI family penicillinase repressor
MRNKQSSTVSPSSLEQLVIEFLGANGPSSAEQVREGLMKRHPMKESTVRTILRRLEAKGYASHTEEGRTYIYSAVRLENMVMRTIRDIIDRFWDGSAPALVAGMVDHEIIEPAELRELSKTLKRPRKPKGK